MTVACSAATKEIPLATRVGKPSAGQKEKKNSLDDLAAVANRVAAGSAPIQQLDLRPLVPTSSAQEETTLTAPPEPSIATTSLGAETAALGTSISDAPAAQAANGPPATESASSPPLPPGAHPSPASAARSSQVNPSNNDNLVRPTELRSPHDAGQVARLQIPIQSDWNASRDRIAGDSNAYVYPQPSTPVSSRAAAAAEPYESDLPRQTAGLPEAAHRTAESVSTAVGTMPAGAKQKSVSGLEETTDPTAQQQAGGQPPSPASPTFAAQPNAISSAEQARFAADSRV